jgi:hypothetical protein
MKIKAGYKTSEFWFTLVSFLFSGLYLTGIINENQHKEELISTVSHAVESCILIGGQLIILYRYVKGRNEVKKLIELENINTEKTNDITTVNSSRSRKGTRRNQSKSTKSKKSSTK